LINRKILFLPQNANQEENFILLANNLVKKKLIQKNNIVFIVVLNAFGSSAHSEHKYEIIQVQWESQEPIYKMKYIQRLINIINNQNKINKCIDITDNILVIGNDGAIQRLLINRFKTFKTFIVADTYISASINRGKLLRWIFQLFTMIKLSHLVPGVSYLSKSDAIFVSENYYKKLLMLHQKRSPVYNVEMPIHRNNFKEFISKKESLPKINSKKIIYITSAFKWHRMYKEHKYQQDDIRDIINHFDNSVTIKIRIHPRETFNDYKWIENMGLNNIQTTYNNDLITDLAWCDLLVTSMSSVGVEANNLGIPIYIYVNNFGISYIKGSIFEDGYRIIDSLDVISQDSFVNFSKSSPRSTADLGEILYSLST